MANKMAKALRAPERQMGVLQQRPLLCPQHRGMRHHYELSLTSSTLYPSLGFTGMEKPVQSIQFQHIWPCLTFLHQNFGFSGRLKMWYSKFTTASEKRSILPSCTCEQTVWFTVCINLQSKSSLKNNNLVVDNAVYETGFSNSTAVKQSRVMF